MLKLGIGINRTTKKIAAGVVYDVDAQAFFDRVTAAGGTTSLTEKTAVNTLVLSLKANNIWTLMQAIYPMVGASAAACAQNLVSASFTGSFSSGWTFANTGVTPNGTSAYMDTTFNASTNFSATSRHMTYYNRTNTALGYDMGSSIGTADTMLANRFTASTSIYTNFGSNASYLLFSTPTAVGFGHGNNIANSETLYKNGALLNSRTNTITNSNLPIFIGGANRNGIATSFTNHECAFCSIGAGMNATEASNLYTAVQAFNTSLSRQV